MSRVTETAYAAPDFNTQQRIIARAHRLRAKAMADAFAWALRTIAGGARGALALMRSGRRAA